MEKLTINIPDKKSSLVKQILIGLGVTIQQDSSTNTIAYREKLAKISIWSDDDLKFLEEGKNAFESLKPQQW
ncbi:MULTISPECIES: hypothetical protein [unclassified Mucilaginibacter]|uniref:hypothetical protein n=1 Tax=unclassified Mucilaginibacter TaxID=2617802 RepID=UPI0008BF6054|nr:MULTISPECIES: hypothetical protein [unclassified Mucilaginibacter]WDF76710.1 hypothetical protein PQ469_22770 [Mucilaginibacter sp. KACC 22773]SEP39025.1 hypothetical protein SAMN05428947_113190 [Mucilaginibacter sp. OK283]